MKAILCDIDNCREDASGTMALQYLGTPSVFHQEGHNPESSKIIVRARFLKEGDEIRCLLQREFDLCHNHITELLAGSKLNQYWSTTKDHNIQDEHFTLVKMKRDRA